MKKLTGAIVVLTALTMTACGNKQTSNRAKTPSEESTTGYATAAVTDTTYDSAIRHFLVDSIGSQYAKADFCVPMPSVVAVDEQNADDTHEDEHDLFQNIKDFAHILYMLLSLTEGRDYFLAMPFWRAYSAAPRAPTSWGSS